jgi:hypothetical protein
MGILSDREIDWGSSRKIVDLLLNSANTHVINETVLNGVSSDSFQLSNGLLTGKVKGRNLGRAELLEFRIQIHDEFDDWAIKRRPGAS